MDITAGLSGKLAAEHAHRAGDCEVALVSSYRIPVIYATAGQRAIGAATGRETAIRPPARVIDIASSRQVFLQGSLRCVQRRLKQSVCEPRLWLTRACATICITETVMRVIRVRTVVPPGVRGELFRLRNGFRSQPAAGRQTRITPRKLLRELRTRGSRSPRGKIRESPVFAEAEAGAEIYSVLFGDEKRPENRDRFHNVGKI